MDIFKTMDIQELKAFYVAHRGVFNGNQRTLIDNLIHDIQEATDTLAELLERIQLWEDRNDKDFALQFEAGSS